MKTYQLSHPHFEDTSPYPPTNPNEVSTLSTDLLSYENSLIKELKQNPTDLISLGGLANFLTNFPDRRDEAIAKFSELTTRFFPQNEDKELAPHLKLPLSIYCTLFASLVELQDKELANSRLLRALELDPSNPLSMGNYSSFLHKTMKNYKEAEKHYLQALDTHPDHASIHVKYANFCKSIKRDNAVASKHFKTAVRLSPKNADVLSSYAVFLHANVNDIKSAEVFYQRAFEADRTHVNNLSNYGLFLSEMKGELKMAEKMYCLAMEVDPKHANSIYNYAVMLDSGYNDYSRAEPLYKRCIEVNPTHSFALYNLAILVEEMRGVSGGEADSFFKRAMEANQGDSVTVADYGRFKLVTEKDLEEAEKLLKQSVEMDKNCVVGNYNYGQLLFMKGKTDEAEKCFRCVLDVDSWHVEALRYLGKCFAGKDDKLAEKFFKKAIESLNGKKSGNQSSSTGKDLIQELNQLSKK